MGESIAVVIVVVILLIIGIAFWRALHISDTKETIDLSQEYSVIELAKTVTELPELKCYAAQSVSKVNCFDYYKIMALKETIGETDRAAFNYYSNYFKNSKITFSIIYPDFDSNPDTASYEIILYDNEIAGSKSQLEIVIPALPRTLFNGEILEQKLAHLSAGL